VTWPWNYWVAPLVGVAITTVVAYVSSGHRGIYLAQRVMYAKSDEEGFVVTELPLRELRGRERGRWRDHYARAGRNRQRA
jgi:hypothetical protein